MSNNCHYRPVVLRTFHTFSCIFFRELFLVAFHGWFAIQTNLWKVQYTTGRFLAQLHPYNFFLKIFFLVPKVSNSRIFQTRCFMKIQFDIRFPYKHGYFKPVCLLVKMASRTVIRPIKTIVQYNIFSKIVRRPKKISEIESITAHPHKEKK